MRNGIQSVILYLVLLASKHNGSTNNEA